MEEGGRIQNAIGRDEDDEKERFEFPFHREILGKSVGKEENKNESGEERKGGEDECDDDGDGG